MEAGEGDVLALEGDHAADEGPALGGGRQDGGGGGEHGELAAAHVLEHALPVAVVPDL